MSLWTPGGEHPVDREQGSPGDPGPGDPGSEPPRLDPEAEAELAEVQRQIAATPARAIVANHAIGLFQLAGVHLSQEPPNLEEARLAIDAMAALLDGLPGRLGPDETTLKDALSQLRIAYVQLRGTAGQEEGGASPA